LRANRRDCYMEYVSFCTAHAFGLSNAYSWIDPGAKMQKARWLLETLGLVNPNSEEFLDLHVKPVLVYVVAILLLLASGIWAITSAILHLQCPDELWLPRSGAILVAAGVFVEIQGNTALHYNSYGGTRLAKAIFNLARSVGYVWVILGTVIWAYADLILVKLGLV